MTITQKPFGQTESGEQVTLYILEEGRIRVGICTLGAAVVSLEVPDQNGTATDVTLGYDTAELYERETYYFGAVVGRCANRIGGGRFTLNGKEYTLCRNNGNNHLHGGQRGFDKKIWHAKAEGDALVMTYVSPDGEEGYPGKLTVTVTYTLPGGNTLNIDFAAACDADTVCNLTSHTYFNLAGHASGPMLNQYIQIFADEYTPADEQSLPNGTRRPVAGTPLDLRTPTPIGAHIDDDFDALRFAGGYDQNFIPRGAPGTLRPAAYAYDEGTGISLTASTTMPGLHFYAGNYIGLTAAGKGGAPYDKRWGFCLESQYFPNAMAIDSFEKPILRAGELYHHTTAFTFGQHQKD